MPTRIHLGIPAVEGRLTLGRRRGFLLLPHRREVPVLVR
jgi:hypothetical protein